MINDKGSGEFVFSLKLANSREARDLLRLSLLQHASTATGQLKVWIAGKTAAKLIKSMFEVRIPTGGAPHDRLRALAPKISSGPCDPKWLKILQMILVFFGVHTSSPLHGNPLLPYIIDLRLAVALCSGPCRGTINEKLEQMAIEGEARAKLVVAWIASLGLLLDDVKAHKASIRHYDLAALKLSHVFVSAVVNSLKECSLMKTVVSLDTMEILLASSRHSVARDDTVVLLDFEQLQAAFRVLQEGGARHIFRSIPALGNLMCLDVGGTPDVVMQVCRWVVADKARLALISASQSWGGWSLQVTIAGTEAWRGSAGLTCVAGTRRCAWSIWSLSFSISSLAHASRAPCRPRDCC